MRHLGAGLHEAEDVVDEQQHVLVLHVAEVLGHRQRRQGDAQADSRRLVHLAEDQRGLLEHARLFHLDLRSVPSRVRSPTPANTDTPPWFCATRRIISVMSTVLPTPAPPNRPILPPATYGVSRSMTLMPVSNRRLRRLERVEVRSGAVDVPPLDVGEVGVVGVEHVAPHVPHVTERAVADGHVDAATGVAHRGAARQTVGRLQADGADAAVAELLGDLGEHGDSACRRR